MESEDFVESSALEDLQLVMDNRLHGYLAATGKDLLQYCYGLGTPYNANLAQKLIDALFENNTISNAFPVPSQNIIRVSADEEDPLEIIIDRLRQTFSQASARGNPGYIVSVSVTEGPKDWGGTLNTYQPGTLSFISCRQVPEE